MKKFTLIGLTALIALNLSACQKTETSEKISRETSTPQEVEIFDLKDNSPAISFTKSGIAGSKFEVDLSPQISGRITDLNIEVGDKVKAGQTLVTLGDSLSTDLLDLQYSSANESLNLSEDSYDLNFETIQYQLEAAENSAESAEENYSNSLQVRKNTKNNLDLQIENAEDNYDDAKDNYEDLKDAAEDDPTLEDEVATAKSQMKQAKYALELLEENYDSQVDQLDSAVSLSKIQYENALNQIEAVKTAGNLQLLGAEGQVIQASSGAKTSGLSRSQKNIATPISGIVTSVNAKENNIVAPGQTLVTIEKPGTISVKTSINLEELGFLKEGAEVEIITKNVSAEGRIAYISPVLNAITGKIDVEIEVEDEKILPGEVVKITFHPELSGRIFIPLNSLYLNDESEYVKIVDGNKVKFIEVKIGEILGSYVEIISGLKGKEKIIATPSNLLEEGEKIRIAAK